MSKPILSDQDFGGVARILNLPNAVGDQEPATLAQLKAQIEGLAWKDSVRVSTQGNISIASPGATIDGITMSANDRVLVRAQTTGSENGIYIWNGSATALTRSLDANTSDELEGAVVTVEEGTSAGATYRQTSVNFTIGSGAVAWTSFGTAAGAATEATAGIAEIATQAETDGGTDDQRIVTPAKLAAWSGRVRKFPQAIGDGSATQIDVTHNLNTRDVVVEVFYASGAYATVICDVSRPTVNSVRLNFAAAPAANALRVVVTG
ncbi:hypothetical protein [Methylobacterium bullatum]|uniref:Uncharacterized protein n=1 Tax=Methylobacterium bullatum TaxID=570505 RepID=A0AAV4ZBG7_9HYPH|nr:hypothetical protein [Methylobacterium bullatum]MBD8902777.1 hypothetical protein [Methylobacterium bullatum]GJD41315.1 hypothetical protein OICFNHDK_3798 [Methylobacterium bullatum]